MSEVKTKDLTIMDRLARGDILISDGATGTYLQTYGLGPSVCLEEFNVSHHEIIIGMAAEYFEAGSDMVLTNSFGGNRFMLKKYGFEDRVRELNRLAAEHARSVAPPGRYVVGSVGPTGELFEPRGHATKAEVFEAFVEQITALEEGGVDGIVVETMMALEEATLAVKAAKENTDLTVFATMAFDKGPRGFHSVMGVGPERVVAELQQAGADVVGSNCGNGIEDMLDIARTMRRATGGYLLVHCNAGMPRIRRGQIVYSETPKWMAERFKLLAQLGINIIGGCCGTTPDHIRALAKEIRG